LYAADQATKAWVVATMPEGTGVPVVPGFFDWVHVRNTGAAFGSFAGASWVLGLFAAVALGVVGVLVVRGAFRGRAMGVAAALLLSGIAGNLTDRVARGSVVDFLSFDLGVPFADPWPAFNVADACICVAAALLVLVPSPKRAATR
jgi:signal peptidase II